MRAEEKVEKIFFPAFKRHAVNDAEEAENDLVGNEVPDIVKVCAPMVRYSKLPFRELVRAWGCDLTYTPMIMANSFAASERARLVDFPFTPATIVDDRPLIVQFGANNGETLRRAAKYVVDACDGIDINCGCPQRWALKEKIGASLIENPELLCDMVRQLYNSLPGDRQLMLSVKIRIHEDLNKTVDLCRRALACGISFITVHGRTVHERHQPAHWDAIKVIADSLPQSMPVIANGDIKCLADAERVCAETGARGAMAARTILTNPSLFAGYSSTPLECVQNWLDLVPKHFSMDFSSKSDASETADDVKLPFPVFHHHTQWMLEDRMDRQERVLFDGMRTYRSVLTFLEEKFGLAVPQSFD